MTFAEIAAKLRSGDRELEQVRYFRQQLVNILNEPRPYLNSRDRLEISKMVKAEIRKLDCILGVRLGCSEGAAQATFVRAIWKLRRHPEKFKKVMGLIQLRAEIRREAQ